MNVEVQIVVETKTTYVVKGVKSLERAEELALTAAQRGVHMYTEGQSSVTRGSTKTEDPFVAWSEPTTNQGGDK